MLKHNDSLICDTDVIKCEEIVSTLDINLAEYTTGLVFDSERIFLCHTTYGQIFIYKLSGVKYLFERKYYLRTRMVSCATIAVTKLQRHAGNLYAIVFD